jgi:DNA-binding transcriptional ArsR family regulator
VIKISPVDQAVWRALSSPIRRRILDLLRDGPLGTGEIAEKLPDLSRFAVMQHLGVLEEGGLVVSRKEGRKRLNFLNAVPVQQVYERWVTELARAPAAGALALKRYVERKEKEMGDVRTIRIEHEMRVKAPVDRVWAAATTEQLEWYPHTYGEDRVKELIFDAKVGGRVGEDWGEGAGVLYGTITYYDPPHVYATRGHLRGGVLLEQWMTVEKDGDESIVKGSTVCFGEITDEMEKGIDMHGNLKHYEDRFREYVEKTA